MGLRYHDHNDLLCVSDEQNLGSKKLNDRSWQNRAGIQTQVCLTLRPGLLSLTGRGFELMRALLTGGPGSPGVPTAPGVPG